MNQVEAEPDSRSGCQQKPQEHAVQRGMGVRIRGVIVIEEG